MSDFKPIFFKLKEILASVSKELVVIADTGDNYCVDTNVKQNGKEIFFGAVKMRKNYVAYHFTPVYKYPGLISKISPGLRKRMQGKSCFNFKEEDEGLFKELEELTGKGYGLYKQEGCIK